MHKISNGYFVLVLTKHVTSLWHYPLSTTYKFIKSSKYSWVSYQGFPFLSFFAIFFRKWPLTVLELRWPKQMINFWTQLLKISRYFSSGGWSPFSKLDTEKFTWKQPTFEKITVWKSSGWDDVASLWCLKTNLERSIVCLSIACSWLNQELFDKRTYYWQSSI